MFKERERMNWTQELRRENLKIVAAIIKEEGGYAEILNNMRDFQRYLAVEMGCSIRKAIEYIDTVRGAALYRSKKLAAKNG